MKNCTLRMRPYKSCDAKYITSWIDDEISFRKWSSDRYENYPVTEADINYKYFDCNGDCSEPDNFYPMTAFSQDGVVGHLIMRFTDHEKQILRFGFIIVDNKKRGNGYGCGMLKLALRYAFDILKVKKVTLGVFRNNEPAYRCYSSVGFIETGESYYCEIMGESWECIEMEATSDIT